VQDEEKRYQIAKDLSDNLTISYNTSEVIMARPDADDQRQGARLCAVGQLLLHHDSVLTASGRLHRTVRAA